MKGQPPPWRRHTAADVERKREISSEREELEERGRDRQTEWRRKMAAAPPQVAAAAAATFSFPVSGRPRSERDCGMSFSVCVVRTILLDLNLIFFGFILKSDLFYLFFTTSDWDSASVQVRCGSGSVRVNGSVNWFRFGLVRVNTANGSVAGFRLGFGSWSKAVNESMVRSIQSTQVNSGQPVNCRVNWSNARRGIL
ncbi:uncharacterized protein LOC118489257 [Helianthus annuus]|uniref:uncharacterized protein LOC118489256 n=1 Tax=Helianthus annuus TaxID=4232 RepID=UPI0016533D3D|nr:uncharacterized protein LOC118489256 [Helianthus annuus]XP_035842888.1 uncharacterized protein LOC118489257 [Helianthus annuus]